MAGPPAGAFLAGAGLSTLDLLARPDPNPLEIVWHALHMGVAAMTLGVIFAFWFGGLQAAAVGLVAALIVGIRGSAPLWAVLAAAALTGVAMMRWMPMEGPRGILMFATHLFAGFVCWLVLRRVLDRWYD